MAEVPCGQATVTKSLAATRSDSLSLDMGAMMRRCRARVAQFAVWSSSSRRTSSCGRQMMMTMIGQAELFTEEMLADR